MTGFPVAPSTVDIAAGERQLIGSAVIFAQHLDRQPRRRFPFAIEFSHTSFTRRHSTSLPSNSRQRRAPLHPPRVAAKPQRAIEVSMWYLRNPLPALRNLP